MESKKKIAFDRAENNIKLNKDDLRMLKSIEIGENSSSFGRQKETETRKFKSDSALEYQSEIKESNDLSIDNDQNTNLIGGKIDVTSEYTSSDAYDKDHLSTNYYAKYYASKYGTRKSESDLPNYLHWDTYEIQKEKTSDKDDQIDHVSEKTERKEIVRERSPHSFSQKESVNRDNLSRNNQDGERKLEGNAESSKSANYKNKRATGTKSSESIEVATKRYKNNVNPSPKVKNSKSNKRTSEVQGKSKTKGRNDITQPEQGAQQEKGVERRTSTRVKVTRRDSVNGNEMVAESSNIKTERQSSNAKEEESQKFSQFVCRQSNYDEEIQEMEKRKLMILNSISPNASFGNELINAKTTKPSQINLNVDMKISLSSSKASLREGNQEDNTTTNTFSGRFYTNMEKIIGVKQYIKVLFPRCIDTNEITWLLNNGHEVVIVEEDESVIRNFFRECNVKYDFENCRAINGNLYRGLEKHVRIYNIEFTSFPPFLETDIDVIWDSDGLRSADKGDKKKFIKVINSLMQSGDNFFMVVNCPDASFVPKELFMFQDVVENAFQIQKLETVEDNPSSPNTSNNDKSQLYLLTKL